MKTIGLANAAATTLVVMALILPRSASAEMDGACGAAVGTFLTKNTVDKGGRDGTSRSLLILTNGGHAIRFDSDEMGAVTDNRPFGDSAGTWRCDGVNDNGTRHFTISMLDFTYPNAEGDEGQIARIDVKGELSPSGDTLKLVGDLGFLPMDADASEADALSKAPDTVPIELIGQRINIPKAP